MVNETVVKFQRELNSLQGLAILNIVFGGLAMSFAIAVGVQNVFAMVEAQSLLLPQLLLVIVGFLVFAISLRWLVSSAELLDGADNLKQDYAKKKASLDDDSLTSLIVKMVAHYRENKPKIRTMMLVSRVAGGCFLVSGGFSLAAAVTSLLAGAPALDVLIQFLGAAFNFAMAAAGFIIPRFFGRYSKIWDYRLEEAIKAEKMLGLQLGED